MDLGTDIGATVITLTTVIIVGRVVMVGTVTGGDMGAMADMVGIDKLLKG